MSAAAPLLFSVIIPTRNRAAQFAVALQSVLDQRFRDFEIIVIDDGSTDEHAARYCGLTGHTPGNMRLLTLARTEQGHGPGHGRNCGAAAARGDYVCFLDDDDQWIDPEHLARVAGVIGASMEPVDLILANQRAFRAGKPVTNVNWIENLESRLHRRPDLAGAYSVTAAELLTCPAHCHLNTTIVSREFFRRLDGFDEGLRYEEDRDFYLRAIDRAGVIKYLPDIVSRHNIPDPASRSSMSTTLSELEKRLYQLQLLDKAALFSVRPELRRYAMRHRSYVLKHIATEAARFGQFDRAAYYARRALQTGPNVKWAGYTAWLTLRAVVSCRSFRL